MSHIILPPEFILPPYHLAPWKLFNDLYFLPISCIIFPLGFIFPPGNHLMIYTIYQCPVSFYPCIILPPGEKLLNDLHFLPMSRIILPPRLDPWIGAVVL